MTGWSRSRCGAEYIIPYWIIININIASFSLICNEKADEGWKNVVNKTVQKSYISVSLATSHALWLQGLELNMPNINSRSWGNERVWLTLLISQLFVTPYYASGKSSSVWLWDISEYKTMGIRRPISNVDFSRLSVFLWSSYMECSCCPSLRRRRLRMCLWTSLGYYSNPFN